MWNNLESGFSVFTDAASSSLFPVALCYKDTFETKK